MGSYDSIGLWLSAELAGVKELPLHVMGKLTGSTQVIQSNGAESYAGYLGNNLRVRVSQQGLSVKGSISKYFLSNNIECLTRSTTEQAMEKLSDELCLPMQKAKLNRMAYALNLVVKESPEAYFSILGDSRYFNRSQFGSTLYYINSNRKIRFYDKLKESKRILHDLPMPMQGVNMLRIELELCKKLTHQFNLSEITASHLYQESFYMAMIDKLYLEYMAIRKNKLIKLNFSTMNSPKDFWQQAQADWIQKIGGEATALNIVENLRKQDAFKNNEYYSRLKKEIKTISTLPALTQDSPLIEELDEKMQRVRSYYR
jgi:hypothetical protein